MTEPVAWQVTYVTNGGVPQIMWMPHPVHPDSPLAKQSYTEVPLYTAPPKKEWVGLTDGDVNYCVDAIYKGFDIKPRNEIEIEYFERVIKFVEAKLKEKNDR